MGQGSCHPTGCPAGTENVQSRTLRRERSRLARSVALCLTLAAVLAPSAAAADPTDPVREAQRFRTAVGLPADIGTVTRLMADPSVDQRRFGVPLTPAELRELNARAEAGSEVPIIQSYGEERAADAYAGVYMDHQDGGVIRVGFTKDLDRHRAAVRARFPFVARLRFFEADSTLSALNALHERIGDDLRDLRRSGIAVVTIATDVPNNAVAIGVHNLTAEDKQSLTERYGEQIRVVEDAAPVKRRRREIQSPPFAGGLQIHSDDFFECTSGFVAKSRTGAARYLLTAGHCGAQSTIWLQGEAANSTLGGTYIGTMAQNEFYDGGEDGGKINMNANFESSKVYANGEYRGISSVESTDFVGQFVCKSGITTEYTCGVLRDNNFSLYYQDEDVILHRQRRATLTSDFGDSGSPIFELNQAQGILSGGPSNSTATTYYSHISRVSTRLQVNVNATDPPPPNYDDLLARYVPQLHYDAQERWRVGAADMMTDNVGITEDGVTYSNRLLNDDGPAQELIADADPSSPADDLTLSYLGPTYPGGRLALPPDPGGDAQGGDLIDAAGGDNSGLPGDTYERDNSRMQQQDKYFDRIYGRVARDPDDGKRWLQYWFFYYYNDGVLGVGNHEADWEMIQIGLDTAGRPDVATYARHKTADAVSCAWEEVPRYTTAQGVSAPVVYVEEGGHGAVFGPESGHNDDPALRTVPRMAQIQAGQPQWNWVAWPGRWGASENEVRGPAAQGQKWDAPGAFNRQAQPCTTESPGPIPPIAPPIIPPVPPIIPPIGLSAPAALRTEATVARMADDARVSYELPAIDQLGEDELAGVMITVHSASDRVTPSEANVLGAQPRGERIVKLPAGPGPYTVRISAMSKDGKRGAVTDVDLP